MAVVAITLPTLIAAAPADIGFWAVIRLRSTTTRGVHAAAVSRMAPAFFRASSTDQGRSRDPPGVWASSSLVQAAIR